MLQLRHTTFNTQSLKEIHSGRETGLIDAGPLITVSSQLSHMPINMWLFKNQLSHRLVQFM